MIWWKIGLNLLLIPISGLFYHMSGLGADGKKLYPWAPSWAFARWWRRIGCMLIDTLLLLLWWQPSIWYGWLLLVATMGIEYGMICTYWDWLFGYDNFYFHGFGIGLARIPLIWAGTAWMVAPIFVLVRAVVLAIMMGWISTASKKDWVEEIGRGSSIAATSWV